MTHHHPVPKLASTNRARTFLDPGPYCTPVTLSKRSQKDVYLGGGYTKRLHVISTCVRGKRDIRFGADVLTWARLTGVGTATLQRTKAARNSYPVMCVPMGTPLR